MSEGRSRLRRGIYSPAVMSHSTKRAALSRLSIWLDTWLMIQTSKQQFTFSLTLAELNIKSEDWWPTGPGGNANGVSLYDERRDM